MSEIRKNENKHLDDVNLDDPEATTVDGKTTTPDGNVSYEQKFMDGLEKK
jgi:hypothetical protein